MEAPAPRSCLDAALPPLDPFDRDAFTPDTADDIDPGDEVDVDPEPAIEAKDSVALPEEVVPAASSAIFRRELNTLCMSTSLTLLFPPDDLLVASARPAADGEVASPSLMSICVTSPLPDPRVFPDPDEDTESSPILGAEQNAPAIAS